MPHYDIADCFEAPSVEQSLLTGILREHNIDVSRLRKSKAWVRPDGGRIIEFDSDDYCSIGDLTIEEIRKEFHRRRKVLGFPDMPEKPLPRPRQPSALDELLSPPKIIGYVGDIPIVRSPRSYFGDLDDSPEFGDDD